MARVTVEDCVDKVQNRFDLVLLAAHRAPIPVLPLAGASSLVLALAASGLNGQSFAFVGYLPQDAAQRAQRVRELEQWSRRQNQTQLVIEAPAPLGQEFTLLLREQRLGATLEQSLNGLARRIPTPTTVLTVSAMRIASETGGGLAEMLERTSHTVRSRLQIEGKIRALTAQGKLQAWIVGLLPIGLMLVLDQMQPVTMSVLWNTPMGWGALAGIGVLEALGIFVIRRIVAIDV